ncbi:MAG: LptF/LptG family permease [Candidatus Muiribacteriota bacterium]
MIKVIDKYILKEFFNPFFFGLFVYITIFLVDILMTLVDLFITRNVQIMNILKLFSYNIPALLILVIPMSVLFATLMVIGNFSGNSELISLKAGGVSFYRILIPFIIIGFFLTLFSFFISETIVPRAHRRSREIYNMLVGKKALPEIKTGDFNLIGDKNVFFSSASENGKFINNYLFETNKNFPVLIVAETTGFDEKNWIFNNGNIYNFGRRGQNFRRIDFAEMISPVFIEREIKTSGKESRDMNFFELREQIESYEKARIDTRKLRFELYTKTALPFASIVFILIGAPLALTPVKAGKSLGMGLSIIIIFLYYVFMSIGRVLGTNGQISPFAGAWLPNTIFIVIGLILVIRAKN